MKPFFSGADTFRSNEQDVDGNITKECCLPLSDRRSGDVAAPWKDGLIWKAWLSWVFKIDGLLRWTHVHDFKQQQSGTAAVLNPTEPHLSHV